MSKKRIKTLNNKYIIAYHIKMNNGTKEMKFMSLNIL
jgi:hypothetical protein